MAKKIVSFRIDPALWKRTLRATTKHKTTATAVVEAALEAYTAKPTTSATREHDDSE